MGKVFFFLKTSGPTTKATCTFRVYCNIVLLNIVKGNHLVLQHSKSTWNKRKNI